MKHHVAIIDPAVHTAETDCFNQLVKQSALPLTYHLPKIGGMASLENLDSEPVGIVVLGSASSVNDGEAWQMAMNEWLMPRMQSGIPTLGLCYGHQLIAHLFGGRVDFLFEDQRKHVGFRMVSLKANRLWGDKPLEGALVVSHKEAVLTCPPDFDVVGISPEVAVDAIAHRTLPIWGFQSHPESTSSFLKSHGIPEALPKLTFGHGLMKSFLEWVAKRPA